MLRKWLVLTVCLGACASAGSGDSEPDPPDAEVASPPDACIEAEELCNGLDDDCDQNVDETFTDLGAECMVGTGECTAAGHMACDPGGLVTICDASSGTPEGELCNGLDDDCDTFVDEGLGVGDPCDGPDGDACTEGVIVCQTDSAVCDDATGDTPELCNGVDDDCRLGADDPWPVGQACTVGVGACLASGTWQCNSTSSVACDATAGSPTAETCGDGIDQDCNGGDVTCPTNDVAGGAIDISAGGTFTGDLVAAHNDHTVGTCGLPAGAGGRDLYYRFSLPAAEVVYLDAFGSNFDTVLRLYSGTCTSIASEVACIDDACSTLQSQSALSLAAGNYCLIVDQYGNGQTNGAVTLTFTRGGRTGTAISSSTSGTLTGTTVGQTNTQTSTTCQSNASGPDVGYYFTLCPAVTRSVTASNCSDTWDTILTLKTGTAATACSDDDCGATVPVRQSSIPATGITGPNLYWIVVDGWNGASGAYSVTYSN